MAKLTKAQAKAHAAAEALLAVDRPLTLDERFEVLDGWREDARHTNSMAGAFFTPWGLAMDAMLEVPLGSGPVTIVDLCAGIGTLALAALTRNAWNEHPVEVTCVELNPDYLAVGRRLVPEATWVPASVFDLPAELGRFDVAISNPPFGAVPRSGARGPRYSGNEFDLHVVDVAAGLADYGVFILPQGSCPFTYSGRPRHELQENRKTVRFREQTGIELHAGIGIDTSYYRNDWHGVSPTVEVAVADLTPAATVEAEDDDEGAVGAQPTLFDLAS